MAGQKKSTFGIQLEPEQGYVDDVLAFANDDLSVPGAKNWDHYLMTHPAREPMSDLGSIDLVDEQSKLRALLVRARRGRERKALLGLLAVMIGDIEIRGKGYFDTSGKFVGDISGKFSSIKKWYSLALLSLLRRDLGSDLKQCPDRDCHDWFVDWPHPGPKRKYCCVQHQDRSLKRKRR